MELPRPLLSVVAPCWNEAEVIETFYREVVAALGDIDFEIVIVDDGSTDTTLAKLNALAQQDPRLVPLSLSRNFGQAIALSAGMDAARGEAIILMDSDLQHPPALLPRMLELWRTGSEIVSTVRETSLDAGWLKRIGSRAFYRILNRISETPIIPEAATFCLLSRRVCDALIAMPERRRFLPGLISWVGFERTLLSFDAAPRRAGTTKYGYRRMFNMALDAIFAFSTTPVQLITRLGLVVVTLGGVYLFGAVLWPLIVGDPVTHWAALVALMLILGGLQVVCIGCVGEYLARILEEARGRPLYLLKQGRGQSRPVQ